jgi:hypothetical protein
LALLLNSGNERNSDQDLQIYDGGRRTVEFAIKASFEREERLKKLALLLNSSNETNSHQDNNVISETSHCCRPGLDQGLIDADVTHDPAASKIRALQIYDANRRTIEFAVKASVEREERLKKLVRSGVGLCYGSKPKRPGFVADASYNSTHASVGHYVNEGNCTTENNSILEYTNEGNFSTEENPILEYTNEGN